MHTIEDLIKVTLFVAVGLVIGFLLWHPSQNSYVGKDEYNSILIENQRLSQENEELKKDMSNLIMEFYTKKFTFDLIGLGKHKAVFCALQGRLKEDIPYFGSLLC